MVRQCVSHDGEAHAIAEWLLGRKAAGYQWGQMAVLYPRHFIGGDFQLVTVCYQLTPFLIQAAF